MPYTPRGRGQIPPYGTNFRRGHADSYDPVYAYSLYILKSDPRWYIRSDKTSKRWTVFYVPSDGVTVAIGKVHPTLTVAMDKLLEGIAEGFYQAAS